MTSLKMADEILKIVLKLPVYSQGFPPPPKPDHPPSPVRPDGMASLATHWDFINW